MTSPTTDTRGRRVAMIVANDISIDGRVKKTAATVAALGFDVTLIGRSSKRRIEGWTGSIPSIWVEDKESFVHAAREGRYRAKHRMSDGVRDRVAVLFSSPSLHAGLDAHTYAYERSRRKLALRQLNNDPATQYVSGLLRPWLPRSFERRLVGVWLRQRKRRIRREMDQLDRKFSERREERAINRVCGSEDAKVRRSTMVRLAQFDDWELAFGPELDRLQPDIVHVHDVHLLGVAVRYKARRVRKRHPVRVIYDAHEYVRGQVHIYGSSHQVMVEHENDYAPYVDAVSTVSPMIAEWLAADLRIDPASISVILNTPTASATTASHESSVSVREAIGLRSDVPLVTYSGGQSEPRGVSDLVNAVGQLDGIHCVLVAHPDNRYVLSQLESAEQRGFGDRIHVVGFVDPERVSEYLQSADLAIHPLRRFTDGVFETRELIANHEAALTNKLFEYLHAHLPIVVSDCSASSSFVIDHGVGVVHRAGDVAHLAKCIEAALQQREQLQANITDELLSSLTWESQAGVLREIYRRTTGAQDLAADEVLKTRLSHRLDEITYPQAVTSRSEVGVAADTAICSLLIGPLNTAGQAMQWARAIRQNTHHRATSLMLDRTTKLRFEADELVTPDAYGSINWQIERLRSMPVKFTHVLAESWFSPLGTLNGGRLVDDMPFLRSHGIQAAVVFHGSDVRDPHAHAQREICSPFRSDLDGLTSRLAVKSAENRATLEQFDGPVFCTTLDLFEDVPQAIWLPVCVDIDAFRCDGHVWRLERPRVLFAPSRSALKGTEEVESTLRELDQAGRIELRRLEGASHDRLRSEVLAADIVIDQLLIGAYGVTAVEGLAAGKVVIGHVSNEVRSLIPGEIPIVEADPSTFASVIDQVIAELASLAADAPRSVSFAATFHDGCYAGEQISAWLEGRPPQRTLPPRSSEHDSLTV